MSVYFTGNYFSCASGGLLYEFVMKRGGLAGVLMTGYLGTPYGRYDAESERRNAHAINPNGTQCFGTTSGCIGSTVFGLKACCNGGAWVLWPSGPGTTTYSDPPYNWVPIAAFYSFSTSGGP